MIPRFIRRGEGEGWGEGEEGREVGAKIGECSSGLDAYQVHVEYYTLVVQIVQCTL
jgi:hypothetical protein